MVGHDGVVTDEQVAVQPTPERWPMWATVGHLAELNEILAKAGLARIDLWDRRS